MTATIPRGAPAQLVALAGQLDQVAARAGTRGLLLQLDRGARVVLEEVDRLADVAVGLAPRLRRLADLERADLQPPLAQPGGGLHQHLGALDRGPCAPVLEAAAGEVERMVDVGLARHGGLGDDPLRVAGVGRDQRAAVAGVVADPDRDLDHRLGVEGLQRAVQLCADRRSSQLQDGLIGERLHEGAASSSSSGVPRACSYRNDSLDVFSSSRRTRYAMPATRSPTGQ